MAWRVSPVAMPWVARAWTNSGISRPAGHLAAQGATHSPAWSLSSNSSAIRRAVRTSSVPVATTMPSAAGMAQDGESVRRPSICTAHKKHDAAGSMPGTWHMVGMRMPSHLAASSTVVPGGTLTCRPSMVRVIIVAHALLRAASSLHSTPQRCGVAGVGKSADAARSSACATCGSRYSWAYHLDGVVPAHLAAHVAAGAETLVHLVLLIRTIRNGAHRAGLRAQRAPDAVVVHAVADQGRAAARGTAPFEVCLVFLAEVSQRGQYRVGRRLPEPAQAAAADVVGQGREFVQVFAAPLSRAEAFQDLQHPLGADAAEGALAAGFRLGEFEEEARDIHHAIALVEHPQAARAHDGAGPRQGIVVDGRIGQARRDAAAAGSAELHGLKFASLFDAAADLFHHFADGDAHGDFDQAAAIDLAGQREHFRAAAGPGAERGERLGAVPQDPRHASQRLDIVDDGGLAAEAAFHRVGRPQFGHAALAFERLNERGLLAADECARPFANLEAQRAQQSALGGLHNGGPRVAA